MFLIHYGEIGLKGDNRHLFENRLLSNIKAHLAGLPIGSVNRRTGFMLVEAGGAAPKEVAERLSHVSGIAYFMEAIRTEQEMPRIAEAAAILFNEGEGTIRVTAKRADKGFPLTSQQVAAKVGAAILAANPKLKVDLHAPDRTCYVELSGGAAWISAAKRPGLGGLPVGSSGKLAALISGGIDSPVAAWMMLRRGSPIHYIHFHNFPYTDRASIDIVRDLIGALDRYALKSTASFIDLTPIQQEIAAECDPRFRVLLYRRMMFRLAERIALREKCGGLVTGESLGQVASQTLENMGTIEIVTTLPVLRPLVGMDKEEIIARAKAIGTYDLSIRPHSDCCSLFLPKRPATKARVEWLEAEEKKLDIEGLIEEALKEEEYLGTSAD
jgi:thiamine biosynthesis protein ThiI